MKIRFKKEKPASIWEKDGVRLSFRAIDEADLMAWYKRDGVKIPADAYEYDGDVVRINHAKLTEEQSRDLELDDDKFIGAKLTNIEGIEDADTGEPVVLEDMPIDERCEVIRAFRDQYPEFDVWLRVYLAGTKKKSASVEFVE